MAKPTPAMATTALAWLDMAPDLLVLVGTGAELLAELLGEPLGALGAPVALVGLMDPVEAGTEPVAGEEAGEEAGADSAAKATVAMTARMAAVENFMVGGSGAGVGLVLGVWFGSGTRFGRVKS